MSDETRIRAALEKYFPRPFTDPQWDILVSQGYVEAIKTGRRTVESVARELGDLMAVLGAATTDTEAAGSEIGQLLSREPRTWEEMEKLVLARAMMKSPASTGRNGVSRGADGRGTPRNGRTPPPRGREMYRASRRPKWLWTGVITIVAVVVVVVLLIMFTRGGTAPSTTTVPAVAASTTTTTTKVTTTTSSSTTTSSTTTTASTTTTTIDLTPTYVAQLSGENSIPPVETGATGTLSFTFAEDRESVDYVFEVDGLEGLTLARLRNAPAGESGEEVVFLYPGPGITDSFSGVVSEGTLTAADLLGPLAGQTISDLEALVIEGVVYLNVGTSANPDGEIRGQLE